MIFRNCVLIATCMCNSTQYERQTGIKTWWEDEQLSKEEMSVALEMYCDVKPDVFITHAVPRGLAKVAGNPSVLTAFGYNSKTFTTYTQALLESCLRHHKPKIHVMGHFHMDRTFVYQGVLRIMLDELQPLQLNGDGCFNHNRFVGCLSKGNVHYQQVNRAPYAKE